MSRWFAIDAKRNLSDLDQLKDFAAQLVSKLIYNEKNINITLFN